MWLCRHSSACNPGGMGGKVHGLVNYWVTDLGQGIEGSRTHKRFR